MPRASIIVPVYNVEKYLRRCVDSILAQTEPDFELILINDGSTDGSGAICDEAAARDARVKVIHKENGGVSSARNEGLKAATGKYIAFVDSDDWLHPQTFELLVTAMDDCDADCVTMDNLWVDHHEVKAEQYTYDNIPKRRFDGGQISQNMYRFIYDPGLKDVLTCGLYGIYKAELFQDLYFNEEVGYGEDIDMICRLNLHVRNVVHLDVPLYYYFTGNESATRCALNKNHFGDLTVLCGISDYYKKLGLQEAEKFQYRYIYRFFDFLIKVKRAENPGLDSAFADYHEMFVNFYREVVQNPYLSLGEKVMLWLLKHKRPEGLLLFGKYEQKMLRTLESFIS